MAALGEYNQAVRVQHPDGAPVPDGDGGATQGYVDATPAVWLVAIRSAAGRVEAGATATTLTTATLEVRGHYRGDLTTASRLVHRGKVFDVHSVNPYDAAGRAELLVTCLEVGS